MIMASEADEGREREYFCGAGSWHPKFLQVFRSAKFFTFLLCLDCFVEGALVSGFTSVVLSTIEKRYRFSSTAAGFIASTFDLSVLVSVLFISYFGGKAHKPRWLGASLIVQGVGALVFASPQFFFGRYDPGGSGESLLEACLDGVDYSSDCSNTSNSVAYFLFVLANILIGVGAAPLFTIGTAYLDEIVHPKYVSVHLGVFYMIVVVGPALGYGLGGAFLSVYVDPTEDTLLEPSDPGWVGAWWLCFVFSGVVSILISVPFFFFPRRLPNSEAIKKARVQEMARSYSSRFQSTDPDETDFGSIVKSFPTHLKQVLCTPSWVFITTAISASIIVLAGMVSFAPKYLESQFSLSTSEASFLAGAVAIPSGSAGVMTGALIIFFTKSKGRKSAFINWIIALLAVVPTLVFLVHCPTVPIAGITTPYHSGSDLTNLTSACNEGCECTSDVFEPVCGASDGLTYFSPCRAGCDKKYYNNNIESPVFENCSCIAHNINTSMAMDALPANATAVEGKCDKGCNGLPIFLTVIAVVLFLIFILQIPVVIVTIRCVADEQRTLALGLQSLVYRAFGTVPGPLMFGLIFDSACLFWQHSCGRRGNCWVYDNTALSYRALALGLTGIILNFVFSFLTWVVYPKDGKKDVSSTEQKSGSSSSSSCSTESSQGSTGRILENSEL